MEYIHSRKSYWNRYGYIEARENDATIIEIDVIYKNGEIFCSRSWRPFEWMMYGRAIRYFQAFQRWQGEDTIYLYIELKTGDEKIIYKLVEMMKKYKNDRVMYLVGGKKNTKRYEVAYEVFQQTKRYCNIMKAEDFFRMNKDNVERIELYKEKPWYKRLNHW